MESFEAAVVPAGRFVIERVGKARPPIGPKIHLTATYRVDPTTMLDVRTDRLRRKDGRINPGDSRQLVSVKRACRPPGP